MNQTFYHSRTGEPFKQGDCSEDSEDEADESLIKESEFKAIDKLSNINSKEKSFMKLWNHHLYETKGSEILIKKICIKFIENYQRELVEFRDQWSMHLVTLFEYRALTGDDLLYLALLLKRFNI